MKQALIVIFGFLLMLSCISSISVMMGMERGIEKQGHPVLYLIYVVGIIIGYFIVKTNMKDEHSSDVPHEAD